MLLTTWEVRCVKLCSSLFAYVPWRFAVEWNSEFTSLEISKYKLRLLPFVSSVFIFALIGLMSIFVVCTKFLLFPDLSFANLVIISMAAVGAVGGLDILRLCVTSVDLLAPGFVTLLKMFDNQKTSMLC